MLLCLGGTRRDVMPTSGTAAVLSLGAGSLLAVLVLLVLRTANKHFLLQYFGPMTGITIDYPRASSLAEQAADARSAARSKAMPAKKGSRR